MNDYKPADVEPKWQKIWDETNVYTSDLDSDKPKYIAMSMFNYPSGAGIHIGHAMNYTISDVKARFKRQQGYESYHPIGWDAFGLPAENYAIKAGVSPQESMATIIPSYHEQYKAMGWSNDWEKEISTHLPEYYKWTQWLFSEMYRHDLAYQDARSQWWCSQCQTVLANEQVIDGKCWRHDGPDDPEVEKREVKQWFFKITDYADELLEAIDDLDWTDSVKQAQRSWIGRSEGAEITFKVVDSAETIEVFTTRPDTIFGATFMVVAPESELVEQLTTAEQKTSVQQYVKAAEQKTDVERQAAKEKTGVFTGSYATNPATDEQMPIWVADYVLGGYGTGAIMAVPGHDQRDNDFARKYDLPTPTVVMPETGTPQENPEYRRSLGVIVENDKGELLTLDWGDQGGRLFIGGGVEEDEDLIETARREVVEETGYTDLEFIAEGTTLMHSYYAHSKKVSRRIKATAMYFKLKSDAQTAIAHEPDEIDAFKVEWITKDQVEEEVTDEMHRFMYDNLFHSVVYTGEGELTGSGDYDGMNSSEARRQIVADLDGATAQTNYKMRDWSVSRQRYWGAPIPIVHCDKCGPVLLPDDQLPIVLPELDDFKPLGDGRSALARAEDWVKTDCPECDGPAERETDTMDGYVCSSWYMLRYFDPHNQQQFASKERIDKWMPVDFYNGGDHATAHLIYVRFVTRFLHDQGYVNDPEPFRQFLLNGKITASDGTMFSKSKGNGIDPLEIIEDGYGADALRMFLMFAAPLEQWAKWDENGVPGTFRFLTRLWNLVRDYSQSEPGELTDEQAEQLLRVTHQMIGKTTADIESNSYNTAIASLMGNLNSLYKCKQQAFVKCDQWQQALEAEVACVAPFAPHIAEELWHVLGHSDSIAHDSWPEFDAELAVEDTITIVAQVNGKLRGEFGFGAGASEDEVVEAMKQDDKIAKYLANGQLVKTVFVPDKLVNFVVK